MMVNMSLCIDLEELLNGNQKEILDELLKCRKINTKLFKVIFWYNNLKESDIKKFVTENKDILFKLNSKITKSPISVWFLIITDVKMETIDSRYKWKGSILKGIDQYIEISNHVISRSSQYGR